MKAYTDITVLLDRSGSMSSIKEAMETGFNKFIKEHAEIPSTRISLVQFDDIDPQEIVYQGVPVAYAEKLVLKPRGNTPLLDAMCDCIDRTGKRFANMTESDRPDQVLMVIITDGAENASRKYNRGAVHERITKQRDTYKWQFLYLGANQDAIAEAASFGIPIGSTVNYAASGAGSAGAWAGTIANTMTYSGTLGASRSKSVQSYTVDQRVAAADNDPTIETENTKINNMVLKNKLKNKQTTNKA